MMIFDSFFYNAINANQELEKDISLSLFYCKETRASMSCTEINLSSEATMYQM